MYCIVLIEEKDEETVEEKDILWFVRVELKGNREGSDVEMIEETVEENDILWFVRVVVKGNRKRSDVEMIDDPNLQSLQIRIRNPRENRQSNVGLSRTSTICRFG